MSGSGVVLGASTTAAGVTGIAMLPETGSFRAMFVVSAIALTIGVVTLAVTGVVAIKQRVHGA